MRGVCKFVLNTPAPLTSLLLCIMYLCTQDQTTIPCWSAAAMSAAVPQKRHFGPPVLGSGRSPCWPKIHMHMTVPWTRHSQRNGRESPCTRKDRGETGWLKLGTQMLRLLMGSTPNSHCLHMIASTSLHTQTQTNRGNAPRAGLKVVQTRAFWTRPGPRSTEKPH